MLDEYQVKQLIDTLGMNAISLNDLMKSNILNSLYLNVSEEQKARITEAFVQDMCEKFKSGLVVYDKEIIQNFLNTDLIHDSLMNLSDEIKSLIEFKLNVIFTNLEKTHDYDNCLTTIKNEIQPFIKKSIQEILSGESQMILKSTLKNITMAMTQISIKDHAENLFKKAQGLVNEEIIKDIIE